jgi:hypothetical protein
MKKLILSALVFVVFATTSCSHSEITEDQVPGAVVTAFKEKYPTAVISKWVTESRNGKTIYEAVAKENGEEIEAEFNADGSFIKEH